MDVTRGGFALQTFIIAPPTPPYPLHVLSRSNTHANKQTTRKDELIRQVTINCAERGLLLLRVRDEIHMTIAAYQTMYESSIAFGIRKALIAEQRKAEMEAKVGEGEQEEGTCFRCKSLLVVKVVSPPNV